MGAIMQWIIGVQRIYYMQGGKTKTYIQYFQYVQPLIKNFIYVAAFLMF